MDRWELIDKLFQQAADLPRDQRAPFLDRVCQGDQELRLEIESLLASDEKSPEFLEGHDLPSNPLQFVEDGEDPWAGKKIGPWAIERKLGGGGMGQVYLASRADGAFQQKAAIKIVKRGMDTDAVLRRFRAERQTLAQLQHPGIARLLDGGSTEDGLPYLVMEFVDGKPLHQFCDEKRLRIGQRLRLFRQVCLAVDAAHRMQVVHRDLKPGNILVTAEGMPKLLDFGIAKMLNPDSVDFTMPRTVTGQSFLTPEYASPEQIRGEAVTVASDVYSLGVILFELLTGRRPERERTEKPSDVITRPQAKDAATTASWHRGADPARLSEMLQGDLEVIALKALHPDPERRYANVRDLAEDLRRYQENLPIFARPDTLGYRLQKLAQRRRREFVVAVLFLFAVSGGWAAIRHYAAIAEEQSAAADRAAQEAKQRQEEIDRLHREFEKANAELKPPAVAEETAAQTASQTSPSVLRAPESPETVRGKQAMGLWNAAYQDYHNRRHAEAREKLSHIVLMMKHGVDAEVFPLRWQSLCYYKLAYYQRDAGDFPSFESNLEKSVEVYELALAANPDEPDAHQYLGGLYEQLFLHYKDAGNKGKADTYATKMKAFPRKKK